MPAQATPRKTREKRKRKRSESRECPRKKGRSGGERVHVSSRRGEQLDREAHPGVRPWSPSPRRGGRTFRPQGGTVDQSTWRQGLSEKDCAGGGRGLGGEGRGGVGRSTIIASQSSRASERACHLLLRFVFWHAFDGEPASLDPSASSLLSSLRLFSLESLSLSLSLSAAVSSAFAPRHAPPTLSFTSRTAAAPPASPQPHPSLPVACTRNSSKAKIKHHE